MTGTAPASEANTGADTPAARLASARRIVVKVGSALLFDEAGALRRDWLAALAADLSALRGRGAAVAVVSSGAIGLGRRRLRLRGALRLEEKQAAAAAGQPLLIDAWSEALRPSEVAVAQVLLTLGDAETRRRYLNARATLGALIELGALPVINENDTTATDEIRYGDNDRLAAHVAQMISADLLVLLSDIDGLYDRDPRIDAAARHIPLVGAIDAAVEAMAGGPNLARGAGSGGMRTKVEAAKIAAAAGCGTLIARGEVQSPLSAIAAGARATLFAPSASPESARRAWIAARLAPAGAVTVDAGAARALRAGASLLAAGVTAVEGGFMRGDAVSIRAPDGRVLGQGLCAYDARDAAAIMGRRSDEAERILGYRRAALIHRDDLALRSPGIDDEEPP